MNFGFTPPDPEKMIQALDDLKAAFQKAADADTGTAQPLFQKLSDKFNQAIDDGMNLAASDPNPNPGKIIKQIMPVMLELKRTIEKIQTLAATDDRVADTMAELDGSIRNVVQSLMGGLPGIGFPGGIPGGFPGAPKNRPTFDEDDDVPAAPTPPKAPKPTIPKIKPAPKKPGNGDFDF